jgi:amino acid adenylation domain-containing protein
VTFPEQADFVSLLRRRADHQPGEPAYRFLDERTDDGTCLTYGELDQRARAIAARLTESGTAGGRALLLYPPGLDYVTALFGCLYAGTVAVPAYPPDPARLERSLDRLGAITRDAAPSLTLTSAFVRAAVQALPDTPAGLTLPPLVATDEVTGDEVTGGLAAGWTPPPVDADSVALLQYTSGSTATPRGVVIGHGNLMHNSRQIYRAFGHSPGSRGVSWLPPYHDMGLIGGILQPLYAGFPVTLMSPADFLRAPLRWLRAISRFRATTSGGPNFAYELCVRKIPPADRAGLDLSEWRVAFNGAEPIRAQTLERFASAFGPSGFRREAFHPCYGLAEATLMVTGGVPWPAGTGGHSVSCGRAADDQRVVVADPATGRPCAPGELGEIWVAGPSVARGYWSRPEASPEVFGARLAGTGEGPFLRTGDQGFLRDGELFVTGRIKDLIIVRGRNLYPQDIELTAEGSHAALRPGCGAAFTVPGGDTERLVIAWELATRPEEADGAAVARAVRSAVAREHDVQVTTVVLLPRGGMHKTSSGKVQRALCAALYAEGKLGGRPFELPWAAAGSDPAGRELTPDRARLLAADPRQRAAMLRGYLCGRIAAACGVAPAEADLGQPLLALGADSLAVTAIGQAIKEDLGVTLPLAVLIDSSSVTDIIRRLDAEIAGAAAARPPAAASETALSRQQRSLWFLHELAPRSSAHNIAAALRLRGRLNVAALRAALDSLVARHPALRTTFGSHDGEPVARVAADATACLREHDLGPGENPGLADRLSEAAGQPFDLSSGPLLRAELYRAGPDEAVLLIVAHHIITDFWSMTTLASELEALYAAGGNDELPPPAASYADVVAFQEALADGNGGETRAYWAGELRGATGELRLTRPAPAGPAAAGTCSLRIDEELTRLVRERARAEGVTVYMLMLAAYQLLLHRYTGQDDLLVGTPVAGRGRPEFERVVGYCMNAVAIRSQLAGGESVRDVLAGVRRRVVGALDHPVLAREALNSGRLDSGRPSRDPQAGDPLFRTLFIYNRLPVRGAGELALLPLGEPGLRRPFADLVAEPVPLELPESPVDLHLTVAEIDQALFVSLRYLTDLLDADGARAMMGHFANIVRAIARDTGQPAATVALLGGQERHCILSRWSGAGDGPVPGGPVPGGTVHELIERQAAATPDAIAVSGEHGQLSYRELNERANRLVHLLARRRIGPGTKIGLYLDQSPGLVVALLAALKSGAAYVPADPAQPHERTAAMFTEARVAVILSQRALADRLPADIDVVCTDDEAVTAGQRSVNPGLAVPGHSPVYVIYTSGTTGKPKGVVVRHQSLANYVRFAADAFAVSASDRVLLFASVSFDASAEQIYLALIRGATLVLRNDLMLSSPREFLAHCARWNVTVLDLPTGFWHDLVAGIADGAALPPALRTVIIGGERAVPETVREWHRRVGSGVRLVNTYGPTETTIVALTRDLTGYDGTGEVPIGRPVPGCTAYVLDDLLQPVPPGVVGELYLGGVCLADGYLDRPALTGQRFVAHPFGPGSRLYRSGDLASFTADGELVYRGRADRQVKLRGYRVEPGEIESRLRELPGITDALVVLRDEPGRLVAYLVATAPAPLEATGLRAALRGRLPEYMIPSAFVTVPSFPLNRNGKTDLAALPAPEPAGPAGTGQPETPAERFLADTFAEVLGLTGIGADDDFFDLGGQSLLAARVIARIRDRYQADVPLRAIFDAPTPAALARLVASGTPAPGPAESAAPGVPAAPPRPVPRDQPLPLSFVQEGIWFLQRFMPESTQYNVPRALRIRGELDVDKVRAAFATLERRHEILRTTFPDLDGEPVQVAHPPAGLPVPVIDKTDVPPAGHEKLIRQLTLEAGQTPFDLANGPLIRLMLLRLGPGDHVLIVVEHHLIHDGWAQGVFLRDFLEIYRALAAGREPRLPELPVQFADYVHWQRRALDAGTLDRLTAFWRQEIDGAPRLLSLPTDRPHPRVQTFSGDMETLVIGDELGGALLSFSARHGATLFMTMFSAFATLLYRYSGQDDILVGVGVANRQRPEAENLLGMMINTILLRARLSGDMSFARLLGDTRDRCLRAYAHQDMPFGRLVRALRPARDLGHTPLCQVLFSFLDTPLPKVEIPGLTFEVIPAHNKTAKFDLNVVVQPGTEDGRITVYAEYNTDVFEAPTVRRMLGHFESILSGAIADPERALGEFLTDLG